MASYGKLIGILTSAVLLACSNFTVESDYSPDTDFASYQTYSWYHARSTGPTSLDFLGDKAFDQRMRLTINAELQAKGFVLKADGDADVDFRINYGILTEDRQDIRSYNTYGGHAAGSAYGTGYGQGGLGVGTTSTQVINYRQGQLIIDVLDKDSVLVWRGTAEGRVSQSRSQEKREERARELVAIVLSNFPPEPTSGDPQ